MHSPARPASPAPSTQAFQYTPANSFPTPFTASKRSALLSLP